MIPCPAPLFTGNRVPVGDQEAGSTPAGAVILGRRIPCGEDDKWNRPADGGRSEGWVQVPRHGVPDSIFVAPAPERESGLRAPDGFE